MFMSYDGGATPACIDKIQAQGHWSQAELGLLGSLDKLGMTFSSILWGRVLQIFPVKWLLVSGLGVNSLSTFVFGTSGAKLPMFIAKLLMGVTQGLQCVWGTCWVLAHSPMNVRTVWLGLGAISAGIGNGIGTAVAGFGTSQGLPYAVAWEVEAAVLAVLWAALVLCPSQVLDIDKREEDVDDRDRSKSASEDGDMAHQQSIDESWNGVMSLPIGRLASLAPAVTRANTLTQKMLQNVAFDDVVEEMRVHRASIVQPPLPTELLARIRATESEAYGDKATHLRRMTSRRATVLKASEEYGELHLRRATRAMTLGRGLESPVIVQNDVLPQIRALLRNRLYILTTLLVSAVMFTASGITFLWVRFFVSSWGLGKGFAVVGFLITQGVGGVVGIALGPQAIDKCGGFLDPMGRYRSLKFISTMMGIATVGAYVTFGTTMLKWRDGTLGDPEPNGSSLLWVIWVALFVLFASFNCALAGVTGINIGAVPPASRSLASGCTVSVQNLLGYALGPLVPGAIMDTLAPYLQHGGTDTFGAARLLAVGFSTIMLLAALTLACAVSALAVARPSQKKKEGLKVRMAGVDPNELLQ